MNSKKIKRILLLAIIIMSGALLTVFWGYRYLLDTVDDQVLPFNNNASIALSSIHQTSTRNGITEWSLDADSVEYSNSENQASFKDPSITFFLENRQKVILTARQGQLNTASKDIMVSDDVTMDHAQYRLKTDALYYKHDKRILYSDKPVELTDDIVCIRADSMVFDLKTNQTRFKGNVETTFRETI